MSDNNDPGLDHLLEEVAVEVLRQDAAGEWTHANPDRDYMVNRAARAIRSLRAVDQAAEPCTADVVITEDDVTAMWFCSVVGPHETHRTSSGRRWKA